MPVSENQAREMFAAIQDFQLKDAQAEKVTYDNNIAIAEAWWDTVKPPIPTARQEALDVYNIIVQLLKSETDEFRLFILNTKLQQANEKFKEIKASV